MKLINLKCPNCEANLEIDEKTIFCPYCGAKILVDDESQNINFTFRKIDEARLKENERKAFIRLKELEYEERKMIHEHKESRNMLVIGVLLMVFPFFMLNSGDPKANEITLPASSTEYKGSNYVQVVKDMKNMGFSNIETIAQNDLITGWITKDGDVASISINGDYDFDEDDIFPKDAKIVITYHAFSEGKE